MKFQLTIQGEHYSQAVLCYVHKQIAFFTTQKLSDQWGEDWHKHGYDHQAGLPSEYDKNDPLKGRKPWIIIKVGFSGYFDQPCDGGIQNQWSVKSINSGAIAWLRTSEWAVMNNLVAIHAGTTLERFCELIEQGGGTVYLPIKLEK